jgi:NAD(P)-dependent dehydrogenase (short-subunit alcohol dehydrogenase family)
MADRLQGKVALVSGGARGLGAAIVELFAQEGAQVIFGDLRDEEGEALERQLRDQGNEVIYTHLDVTAAEDWTAAVTLARTTYGRLTTLVNNAALNSGAGLLEITPEAWSQVLSANLTGQLLGMQAAMPALLDAGDGAAVVNVASVWANIAAPGSIAYHASKGGVRSMTKSVALEYVRQGVRVNSLHPGMIDTDFGGTEVSPQTLQELLQLIPMKRKASPREIAFGALFLASDESSYMIGAELILDGGWSVP